MRFFKQLYLENRFFYGLGLVILVFIGSFALETLNGSTALRYVALACFGLFLMLLFTDMLFLFVPGGNLSAWREFNPQLSLGDENEIRLKVRNDSRMPFSIEVVEELPYQLQVRDFSRKFRLARDGEHLINYSIRPVKRGEYKFGSINIFLRTFLKIASRRVEVTTADVAKVYPSIIQMKKYELKMLSKTATLQGIKKIRRLGMNNEFEQIKNYVQGDDYRSINWRATSRRNELMVNQYQDEKAQQVYFIIDKSRSMRMPFNNMSLLDHAINTTLVMSNIAMIKGDKAGVLTFSDKMGSRLAAERGGGQLRRITETLFKQKTRFLEANFELLYYGMRQHIKGRSLVLLFTNFESNYALERVMPLLRRINRTHLLVVIFFENTELSEVMDMECKDVKEIYFKTMAEKFTMEKSLIVRELGKYGIQSIISKPEELSVNTINKYLELKSRGMI